MLLSSQNSDGHRAEDAPQSDDSRRAGKNEDHQQADECYRCGHHYVVATSVGGMPLGFEVRHDALQDMNSIWAVWTLEEAIDLVATLQAIDKRESL